ncbi:hypothetical protein APA_5306 [Pseudanabaena sp. lw0831]|nr:hypothetical protein APA_5306 [Pseudanabaena sp. lw0831]
MSITNPIKAIAYSSKIKQCDRTISQNTKLRSPIHQKLKQCDQLINQIVQRSLEFYTGIVEIPLYCFQISFLNPRVILTFLVFPTLVVKKILNVLIL